MINQSLPRLSFTSGELTPWLFGRTDLDAVARGASHLNNMLVSPFGGLERRYGTEWVARAGTDSGAIRLLTFAFSNGDQFILELGRGYIRYYQNGELVTSPDGTPYVTPTPWVTDEMIANLRMQQLNDVIYFVCPLVYPHTLERYGDTDWRISRMKLKSEPVVTLLDNKITLQYERSSAVQGAFLKVSADDDVFTGEMEGNDVICISDFVSEQTVDATAYDYAHVGSLNRSFFFGEVFRMEPGNGWAYAYTCIQAFNPSLYTGSDDPRKYPDYFTEGVETHSPLMVPGGWNVQTYGTWNGHWAVEKSYMTDPGLHRKDWICVRNFIQSEGKRQNYSISGEETSETRIRVIIIAWQPGTSKGTIEVRVNSAEYRHWMRVIKVADARTAWLGVMGDRQTYLNLLNSGTTIRWTFGAFGHCNGFPSAVEFHQGRLLFASTAGQPQTVWASAVDDLDRFFPGSQNDSPFTLTLAASQQNRICWLSSLRGLVIGTSEGEWLLKSSDGETINSSNAAFEKQSGVGSSFMDSLTIENALYFLQQGGTKVREFAYSLESDGFVSTDIGILAEHILATGIVDWAIQKAVSLRLWCVLKDGSLACLTSNKAQNVIAWQRHKIAGGRVLSVASTRTGRDWKDEVWFAVLREDGEGQTYSIERMSEDGVYLDSHVSTRPTESRLANLTHLAGKGVIAYSQDAPDRLISATVAQDGTIDIESGDYSDSPWVVGMPYESRVTTMPLEFMEMQGAYKQQIKSKMLMKNSGLDFEFSGDIEQGNSQQFEPARHGISAPYSGYVELTHYCGGGRQPRLTVSTQGIGPLNILALIPEVAVANG